MGSIPSERGIRSNVADTADKCGFCGWEPEGKHVSRPTWGEGEDYYGIDCRGCPAWYEHDMREWRKPVAPGEEQKVVSVE